VLEARLQLGEALEGEARQHQRRRQDQHGEGYADAFHLVPRLVDSYANRRAIGVPGQERRRKRIGEYDEEARRRQGRRGPVSGMGISQTGH
jgi:hypothetical protein